jgi:two-component system OmpR family response regulator
MAKTKNKPVVYSALEVANICGVVNQTAINWIRSSYLKAFKTPGGQFRVYPDDLAEFMVGRNMRIPAELLEQCSNQSNIISRSILIVDDDVGFNNVMEKYIEKKFDAIQIYQAFDGFDAGSQMTEKRPKCVILDLDLPGVDGFDLCRRIKESETFGKPAIIIVTALQDADVEKKCMDLGVSRFFKKPINFEELVDAIKKAL